LHAAGIAWLSRLPDTFGAAEYGPAEHTATIRDRSYRLVVYRAPRLDQRKAKAFDRELAWVRTAADRAAATLADQPFECVADAAGAPSCRRSAPVGDHVSRHGGLGPAG